MIRITTKGKDLITRVFPEHLLQLEQSLMNLDLEEKRILSSLFKKLNNKV